MPKFLTKEEFNFYCELLELKLEYGDYDVRNKKLFIKNNKAFYKNNSQITNVKKRIQQDFDMVASCDFMTEDGNDLDFFKYYVIKT